MLPKLLERAIYFGAKQEDIPIISNVIGFIQNKQNLLKEGIIHNLSGYVYTQPNSQKALKISSLLLNEMIPSSKEFIYKDYNKTNDFSPHEILRQDINAHLGQLMKHRKLLVFIANGVSNTTNNYIPSDLHSIINSLNGVAILSDTPIGCKKLYKDIHVGGFGLNESKIEFLFTKF